MANFFSLQDGNITDASIYGYSLSSGEVTTNTTGVSLLTSELIGSSFVSDGSTINAIALHLSSRQASTSDTISLNVNVYNTETNIIDVTNNSVITNVSASVVTDSYSVSSGATSIYFPASSYLQIPSSNYTKFSTNPFTLEFWFKTNATADNTLLFSNQNSPSNGLQIITNTDNYSYTNTGISIVATAVSTPSKFVNEGSYYINNITANSSYISLDSTIHTIYNSLNWTIQYWIYQTRYGQAVSPTTNIFHLASNNVQVFTYHETSQLWWTIRNTTNTAYVIERRAGLESINLNQWYHIAIVRNGTSISLLKDGVVVDTYTIGSNPIGSDNSVLTFGPNIAKFYISNISLQYKAIDFGGNPPSAPLDPKDPSNILLLRSPYDTSASYYQSKSTGYIKVYNGNTLVNAASTTSYRDNNWHHLALTRNASGSRLFIDGTLAGVLNASQASTNFDDTTPTVWSIGKPLVAANGSDVFNYNYYQGHISNVRAITGTALYTANFTPSTSPLTNISGTTLLINNTLGFKSSTNLGTYPISGFTSYNGSNNLLTNYPQNWQILKFNPLTSIAGDIINISLSASSDNQISLVSSPLTSQDISPNNSNSYFVGTASLTSSKPYANFSNSVYVNGSNNYLTIPYNSTFNFAAKNFTIECWFNVLTAETYATIFSRWAAPNTGFILEINNTSKALLFYINSNSNLITGPTITYNTWYHVAVVRNGSTVTLYVNGSAVGTPYNISNNSVTNTQIPILLGRIGENATGGMTGYINDFRVTNGNAVYTSNFTPPSAAPLSYIPNTVYLLKSGANYNKSIINNNPVLTGSLTLNATTLSATNSPYDPNGSIKFNGTSSFVNLGYVSRFPLNGDFTIEFGFNFLSLPSTFHMLVDGWYSGSTGVGNSQIALRNTGTISFYYDGGSISTTNTTFTTNTWYYIAYVRKNGVVSTYVNGVLDSTFTFNGPVFNKTNNTFLGKYNTNQYYLNGYISNFRIVNGNGLYTSNFTPPTIQSTSTINTAVLFNASTYSLSSYKYSIALDDLHIGGALSGSSIDSRTITADTYSFNNIYVHNQGTLNFPLTSNKTLTLNGAAGLQITSDGTLNVGTSSGTVPLSTTHTISLSNTQIDVHNGGNLNIYGYPKLFTTNLVNDTVSGSRTFTTTGNVSSTWSVGDTLIFKPNLTSRTGFDTLILSSFTGANTFTTTVSTTYTHTGSATYSNIAGVYNLNRNVKIQGLNSTNRATIRTIDAAKTYINYVQLSNFGINSSNKTGFVLGNNSSGITTLSGIVINSDNTSTVNNIAPLTGRTFQNSNIINNIINNSNTLALSSLNINNVDISDNYILSSGGTSLQINNLSGSINMSNNTTIGSLSYGTYLYNNALTGTYGANNFNSSAQGIYVAGSNTGTIVGGALNSAKEGVYVDASTSNLSGLSFQNILANNNSSVGFKVSGNSLTYTNPVVLNINGLLASSNNTYGIEAYNITGNISSVTTNANLSGDIRTSIGNGYTTFDGLTSTTSGTCLNILSAYNYYDTIIKNSYLSSSNICIILDSTRFGKFSIENSTLSGSTPIQLNVTRNLLEGSYLFNNNYMGNISFVDLNKYQSNVYKNLGFAFMNHNKLSGNHFSYIPGGTKVRDTVVYDPSTADNVSERLTPITTNTKLRSSSKFVAINSGDLTNIRVNVLVVSGYNGNPPRLILKRNASAGVYSDMVLNSYDMTLGYNEFFELVGTSPYVIDNSILEFYVDCDGTSGYICVDTWYAN